MGLRAPRARARRCYPAWQLRWPLVTDDGQVVGINYATWSRTNTDQFYAIEAGDAQSIVKQLTKGQDVDSLGINGQAVTNDDGSLTGLWVSGVTSGSPADLAGIDPGDIITRLEGVSVGSDGTMRDYCDVMRTHSPGDVLAVEVVRYATQEVLTGQFNGAFAGLFETYSDCGGTGASSIIVAAFPPDSSYGVLVVVQVVTDADLVALDEVLRSFDVVA